MMYYIMRKADHAKNVVCVYYKADFEVFKALKNK